VELDVEGEMISRLSSDQHLRSGAARRTWPVRTWFGSGPTMRGRLAKIHLVGRSTSERHVWPMFVIPIDPQVQLLLHTAAAVGLRLPRGNNWDLAPKVSPGGLPRACYFPVGVSRIE
jgi:hypothetical protein